MQQIVKDLNFDRRVCPCLVEKGFFEHFYMIRSEGIDFTIARYSFI